MLVLWLLGAVVGQPAPERQRQVDEATAGLRAAVALRPGDAAAHVALAAGYTEHNFHRTAAEALTAAAALAPDDAETQYLLGVSCLRSRQPKEAEAALRRAIALRPAHGESYVHLAKAIGTSPASETEREALFRSAVAAAPHLHSAVSGLTRLLTGGNRLREAEDVLRAADPQAASKLLFDHLTSQSRSLEAACAWRSAQLSAPSARLHGGIEAEWAEFLSNASHGDPKCLVRRCVKGLDDALSGAHLGHDGGTLASAGQGAGAGAAGGAKTGETAAAAPHLARTNQLELPADASEARKLIELAIRVAEPVVFRGAARGWRPLARWTLAHLGAAEGGGADPVDVTVVVDREVFEVQEERILRPPKSTARLADLVNLLHLKVELKERQIIYTRQASAHLALYKILFYFKALLWESIILFSPPPLAKPTQLQFYCTPIALYTPPHRPLFCMPYTVYCW